MKKTLLSLFFVIICLDVFCQVDTIRLKHTNYTTVFSISKHYPVLVEWWITKTKVGCQNPVPRINNFAPDPLLKSETNLNKDYTGSGFDKGHNCNCDINQCQGKDVESECFFFSNMAPQIHGLNAGSWKTLETNCNKLALQYDSIHVFCGSIGEVKKIGRVSVPAQCWKIVYIKRLNLIRCYVFQNSSDNKLNQPKSIGLFDLQKLTGLKFKFK